MKKSNEFSAKDTSDLKALTHAIRKEMDAVKKNALTIGKLLNQVNDRGIYRITHATFAEYVNDVFGKGKTWAYGLMAWAGHPVLSAIADNEHQARQITSEAAQVAAATGEPRPSVLGNILTNIAKTRTEEAQAERDRPSLDRPQRNPAKEGLQAIRGLLGKCLKVFDRIKLDLVSPDAGEKALVDAIGAWEEQQLVDDRAGKAA